MWLLMLLFSNTLHCVSQTAAHSLEDSEQETEGRGLFLLLFRLFGSYHSYSPAYMKENCKKLNANGWGKWGVVTVAASLMMRCMRYNCLGLWKDIFHRQYWETNWQTSKNYFFFFFLIPMCSATAVCRIFVKHINIIKPSEYLKLWKDLKNQRRNSTMTPPFQCHAEERQQVCLRAGPVAPP